MEPYGHPTFRPQPRHQPRHQWRKAGPLRATRTGQNLGFVSKQRMPTSCANVRFRTDGRAVQRYFCHQAQQPVTERLKLVMCVNLVRTNFAANVADNPRNRRLGDESHCGRKPGGLWPP